MARHHIIGSEVRRARDLSPGLGSMRLYPRRPGGLLHTVFSFAVILALVILAAALMARAG